MPLSTRAGSSLSVALLLCLLAAALTGCGMVSTDKASWPAAVPDRTVVQAVPFFPQEQYQCGPAALAMALGWSGITVAPADLSPQAYTSGRQGSLQADLISAARRHGRVAYPLSGPEALVEELAAGRPVIVLLNRGFSWYPKWHYAVAIGYDYGSAEIILHSGATPNDRYGLRLFDNLWARSGRWGLLVLPPDQLPAEAREETWLAAVIGLERAGQWPAAATAYEKALSRWPESFGAWMGLGNSRYAAGDLAGAAAAFKQAGHCHPRAGAAFNNLAQVLWEMGDRKNALAAAQQAVRIGGPLLENFKRTRQEIEAGSRTDQRKSSPRPADTSAAPAHTEPGPE